MVPKPLKFVPFTQFISILFGGLRIFVYLCTHNLPLYFPPPRPNFGGSKALIEASTACPVGALSYHGLCYGSTICGQRYIFSVKTPNFLRIFWRCAYLEVSAVMLTYQDAQARARFPGCFDGSVHCCSHGGFPPPPTASPGVFFICLGSTSL